MEVSYVLDVPTSWWANYSKLYALWTPSAARCACLSQLWLVQCSSPSTVRQRRAKYAGTESAGKLQWLCQCAARNVLCTTRGAGRYISTCHEWFRAGQL